jgi:hypothetical protein
MTLLRLHALQSVLYFRNNIVPRQDEIHELFSRIRSNKNSQDINRYFVHESKINLNWYNDVQNTDFTQGKGSGVEFSCHFVRILFLHIATELNDGVDSALWLHKMAELVQCYEEYLNMAWKHSGYEDQKKLFEYIGADSLAGVDVFDFLQALGVECVHDLEYANSRHFDKYAKKFSQQIRGQAKAVWQKYTFTGYSL